MALSSKKPNKGVMLLWFLIGLFIFSATLGWLPQPPSHEEMYGDTGRIFDWLSAGLQKNGFWWTPAYLMGHSLSVFAVAFVSQFCMTVFIWIGFIFGLPLVGLKFYNLLILLVSGWGVHRWITDQTQNSFTGALAAFFYVTGPMITLRTCVLEHSAMAMSFVFVPWIFRGIYMLSRVRSRKEVFVLGFCAAGLALSYTKVALLLIPLLALWAAACLDWNQKGSVLPALCQWGGSVGVATILVCPFLLPAARDFGLMAAFLLDPFEGWQEAFAYRSAVSLVDLWEVILPGAAESVSRNSRQFHFGLIPMGFLLWGLVTVRLKNFRKSPVGRSAIALVFVGLVGLWFASGQKSITGGLVGFLSGAQGMKNWTIPIVLGAFCVQGLMVWRCGQELIGKRFAWLLLVIFLFVPGFRFIEKLPLYGDIRGPEAFWAIGAYTAMLGGAAIFAGQAMNIFSALRSSLILVIFLALDVSPTLRNYFDRGLPKALFQAYESACERIKQSGQEGRILPLSGRYFYLTLPQKTGMPISTEAAGRHFQMKWIRYLENAGNTTPENLRNYLNVAGVSYIWIDRQDPDTPLNLQQYFQQIFPQAFQDEYFTVLLNPSSLYPAFLANQGAVVPPMSFEAAPSFLELSRLNFIAVESQSVPEKDLPAVAANMGKTAGEFELMPEFRDRKGDAFQRVAMQAPRLSNYGAMTFQIPARTTNSWLVICEAYHPDWRAFWNGRQLPVCRAVGGLLAVPCPPESGQVRLEYQPPEWYSVSYVFGIGIWVSSLFLFGFGRWGGRRFRSWWADPREIHPETSEVQKTESRKAKLSSGEKILKLLVILPAHNEGMDLQHVFEEVQAKVPGGEILVLVGNTSDGAATKVRQTPAFGKKVHLLERSERDGLSSFSKEAFAWAQKRGYDAVIMLDAGLSYDPADIPKLIQALAEGADIAVGSRYLNGVRVLNWPQSRLWMSLCAAMGVRMLVGLPMTDPGSGFHAIRRRVLEGLDWDKAVAPDSDSLIEIYFRAWQGGFRLQEVPIIFTERRGEHSKISWQMARGTVWQVIQLAIRRVFP